MKLDGLIDTSDFAGVMVLSDIHAMVDSTLAAIKYARLNRLFIVFLGDLVDGGDKPYETVSAVRDVVASGAGALIIGNHDYKYTRHAAGRPVLLKDIHLETIRKTGWNTEVFFDAFRELDAHPFSDFIHTLGSFVFAHGAVHGSFWGEDPRTVRIRERALYGEVDGTRDADDFPVRTYRWVDRIPAGRSVIVGHDRRPVDSRLLEDTGPTIVRNMVGGKVFFTDTGSGKTEGGYLSGTVLSFTSCGTDLEFDRFVKF